MAELASFAVILFLLRRRAGERFLAVFLFPVSCFAFAVISRFLRRVRLRLQYFDTIRTLSGLSDREPRREESPGSLGQDAS